MVLPTGAVICPPMIPQTSPLLGPTQCHQLLVCMAGGCQRIPDLSRRTNDSTTTSRETATHTKKTVHPLCCEEARAGGCDHAGNEAPLPALCCLRDTTTQGTHIPAHKSKAVKGGTPMRR